MGIPFVNSLNKLATHSDVLTLHLALNKQTHDIIGKRILTKLPRHTILINTAQTDLLNHTTILRTVHKHALHIGLDVHKNEPKGKDTYETKDFDIPATTDNGFLYSTPHISTSTDKTQLAIATEAMHVIRSFLLKGNAPNIINVVNASSTRFLLVIRMLDKIGTFANVLNVIKRHGINVKEIANTIFEDDDAAYTKLHVVSRPNKSYLHEIYAFDKMLHVDIVTLPNLT